MSENKNEDRNIENFSTLPVSAQQFLHYMRTIKGGSKLTVREYVFDLRLFFQYEVFLKDNSVKAACPQEIDVSGLGVDFLESVTKDDIFSFIYYISESRDNENRSRARKLSAIKSYYKYMKNVRGLIEENPAQDIEYPKQRQTLPKHLSLDESIRLLETVKNDVENPYMLRDYCILTLFLNCGMRLSELCGINVTDISDDIASIRILGKRNKERFIPLNEASRESLIDYLKHGREKEELKDPDAVFLSKQKRRISNSMVQKMADSYFLKAGMADKNYSVHKLRHTAATLMYQYGGTDTNILMEILGHENLNTTQIYTHTARKQIIEAVEKNPLAKIKRGNVPDKNKQNNDTAKN